MIREKEREMVRLCFIAIARVIARAVVGVQRKFSVTSRDLVGIALYQ